MHNSYMRKATKFGASGDLVVKNLPPNAGDKGSTWPEYRFLKKEMATYYSILPGKSH